VMLMTAFVKIAKMGRDEKARGRIHHRPENRRNVAALCHCGEQPPGTDNLARHTGNGEKYLVSSEVSGFLRPALHRKKRGSFVETVVFWDVTPCRLVHRPNFGLTCYLYLHAIPTI
jgi:hypothetical protein